MGWEQRILKSRTMRPNTSYKSWAQYGKRVFKAEPDTKPDLKEWACTCKDEKRLIQKRGENYTAVPKFMPVEVTKDGECTLCGYYAVWIEIEGNKRITGLRYGSKDR